MFCCCIVPGNYHIPCCITAGRLCCCIIPGICHIPCCIIIPSPPPCCITPPPCSMSAALPGTIPSSLVSLRVVSVVPSAFRTVVSVTVTRLPSTIVVDEEVDVEKPAPTPMLEEEKTEDVPPMP